MNELPNDLLVIIFSFLNIRSLFALQCICKRFKELCSGDPLWKPYVLNQLPKYRKPLAMPWKPIKSIADGCEVVIETMSSAHQKHFIKRENAKLLKEFKLWSCHKAIMEEQQVEHCTVNLQSRFYDFFVEHLLFLETKNWRNRQHIRWQQKPTVLENMNSLRALFMGLADTGMTSTILKASGKPFIDPLPNCIDPEEIISKQGAPNVCFWDSIGYGNRLRALSYYGTQVHVVCFAVNSYEQMNYVRNKWSLEASAANPNSPIIVLGTKCDLRDILPASQLISWEEGIMLAKVVGASNYMECSAHTGEGVAQLVEEIRKLYVGDNRWNYQIREKEEFSTKPSTCILH